MIRPRLGLALENDAGRWIFLTNRSPDEVAQVSLTGVMRAGAACTGFRGLSPSGSFSRIELEPGGDTVELPPLSIYRITAQEA